MMKKRVLVIVMVGVVVAAGIIAGRARAKRNTRRTSVPPATIVLLITEYGQKGEVVSTLPMVRRQYSDGSWQQHMDDRGNGKPFDSSGRVDPAHVPSVEQEERAAAEFGRREDHLLGYRVFVQKDSRAEFWYSPELDAVLKTVIYNKDGSISDVTEAIAVTPGEPTKELSALSKDK